MVKQKETRMELSLGLETWILKSCFTQYLDWFFSQAPWAFKFYLFSKAPSYNLRESPWGGDAHLRMGHWLVFQQARDSTFHLARLQADISSAVIFEHLQNPSQALALSAKKVWSARLWLNWRFQDFDTEQIPKSES